MEGIIKAICISEQKGTEKHPVQDIEIIEDHGLEKDAPAHSTVPTPGRSAPLSA